MDNDFSWELSSLYIPPTYSHLCPLTFEIEKMKDAWWSAVHSNTTPLVETPWVIIK